MVTRISQIEVIYTVILKKLEPKKKMDTMLQCVIEIHQRRSRLPATICVSVFPTIQGPKGPVAAPAAAAAAAAAPVAANAARPAAKGRGGRGRVGRRGGK